MTPTKYSDLHASNLSGAVLVGVDLTGINLRGADLRGCMFLRCTLHDADLDGALVHGATFLDCDLAGASFRHSHGLATVRSCYVHGASWTWCEALPTGLPDCVGTYQGRNGMESFWIPAKPGQRCPCGKSPGPVITLTGDMEVDPRMEP